MLEAQIYKERYLVNGFRPPSMAPIPAALVIEGTIGSMILFQVTIKVKMEVESVQNC
jgi:hypothetical protein